MISWPLDLPPIDFDLLELDHQHLLLPETNEYLLYDTNNTPPSTIEHDYHGPSNVLDYLCVPQASLSVPTEVPISQPIVDNLTSDSLFLPNARDIDQASICTRLKAWQSPTVPPPFATVAPSEVLPQILDGYSNGHFNSSPEGTGSSTVSFSTSSTPSDFFDTSPIPEDQETPCLPSSNTEIAQHRLTRIRGQHCSRNESLLQNPVTDNGFIQQLIMAIDGSDFIAQNELEPTCLEFFDRFPLYQCQAHELMEVFDLKPKSSIFEVLIQNKQCLVCGRETGTRLRRAISHVRGHFGHRPFACVDGACGRPKCNGRFLSQEELTSHSTPGKPIQCGFCDGLICAKNMKRHLEKSHPGLIGGVKSVVAKKYSKKQSRKRNSKSKNRVQEFPNLELSPVSHTHL